MYLLQAGVESSVEVCYYQIFCGYWGTEKRMGNLTSSCRWEARVSEITCPIPLQSLWAARGADMDTNRGCTGL